MKLVNNIIGIFFLVALAPIMSCEENDCCGGYSLSTDITLKVVDKSGLDLLDPSSSESYSADDIRIFYEIDGEVSLVFHRGSDSPYGFWIIEYDTTYLMGLGLNASNVEDFPLTYIQWDEEDTDTVKCVVSATENSKRIVKVWYNDDLLYDVRNGIGGLRGERIFEIIK